ncbi:MAG: hypothetical protein LBR73_09750 [Oscillospiraceae bacterium]|jgi:Zn-dependent protease|nr:hypothetical protein [Oscillospiraceae bacterium]
MTLFKKGPVPVRVGISFAAMLALVCAVGGEGRIGLGLLYAGLHELGHAGAMLLRKNKPHCLCLTAAGLRMERSPGLGLSLHDETVIAAAGPLGSALFAGLAFAAFLLFSFPSGDLVSVPHGWLSWFLVQSIWLNAGFALFNLLPIRLLDGGRIVYFTLCRYMTEANAELWSRVLSGGCIVLVLAFAIYQSAAGKATLSLWAAAAYLLLNT